jgi:CheY-like chemotaxis protein
VAGPAVFLQPASAQILALVLHELATNAAKYGALSNGSGCVRLTWGLDADGLTMRWKEDGGPSVAAPVAQGYGTRVIGASVERQLAGRASFDWSPGGLCFTMTVPPGEKATASARAVSKGAAPEPEVPARATFVAGNRLLLIEDEALVGMMMKETLLELGFEVIGPYGTVADATAAIFEEDFHGAILDVNLDGELVYPLAEMVAARGVPFVFVTGYSADGIDSRFAEIPVLQKPVERQQLQSVFARYGNGSGSKREAPSFWQEGTRQQAAGEGRRA